MDPERINPLKGYADKLTFPPESVQTFCYIQREKANVVAHIESEFGLELTAFDIERIVDICLSLETTDAARHLRAHIADASIGRLILNDN